MHAMLDELFWLQLLFLLSPACQPQGKDHSHHPCGVDQQDMQHALILFFDGMSQPERPHI
jgi:hypothetical protein